MKTFSDPLGHWNKRFEAEGFVFGTEPNAWLREHADVWKPGARVLSVADGEGRNSVWLASRGLHVDAFDLSDVAVRKAQEFAGREGVHVNYAVADIADLDWPEALYDGVAVIFIQFANPQMRARIFEGVVRCLKPGGTLVLQGYTPKQIAYGTGGPKVESHMYTGSLLRDAFAGMHITELREYEAELDEGTGHKGRSALVGMVARKPT